MNAKRNITIFCIPFSSILLQQHFNVLAISVEDIIIFTCSDMRNITAIHACPNSNKPNVSFTIHGPGLLSRTAHHRDHQDLQVSNNAHATGQYCIFWYLLEGQLHKQMPLFSPFSENLRYQRPQAELSAATWILHRIFTCCSSTDIAVKTNICAGLTNCFLPHKDAWTCPAAEVECVYPISCKAIYSLSAIKGIHFYFHQPRTWKKAP